MADRFPRKASIHFNSNEAENALNIFFSDIVFGGLTEIEFLVFRLNSALNRHMVFH